MSDSDSSIAEDESLSHVDLQPAEEEDATAYDLLDFDAVEPEEEKAEEIATLPCEPAATAAAPVVAAVAPLSSEFRSLLQAQPPPFSPIKATATVAAAAPAPAPAPAAVPVIAPAPLPPPLGILDPTMPADSEAAAALSRTEPLPILARLITRVRRKQGAETAGPNDSAAARAAVHPAPPVQSAALAPLPPAVLGSLLDRLRSAGAPASKASWALQPDLLPVAAPPLRHHPQRTSSLQAQLDQQRAAFYSASAAVASSDDKENAVVIAVSADPSYEAPTDSCSALDVDSRLTSAQRFPPSAQPLQLAVAQTRMQAALLSMKTHQFRSAYSLPQSQAPCDFGATILTTDSAATTTLLDPAAPLDAPLPSISTRHACSNRPAIHRDPWLDPVLNRLYASRMNPASGQEEQAATRQLHATIVQTNSMRTQRDLFHATNRNFFQCGEQ